MNYMLEAGASSEVDVRHVVPHWNWGMIAASIGISLLGAFTSTQLMCQARLSRYLSGVLLWSCLASLTFGFCSIWCLHFVAMLACELDLPIGLNVLLTVLSAVLAVSFTFAALSSDLVWDRYRRQQKRSKRRDLSRSTSADVPRLELNGRHSLEPTRFEDEPTSHANIRPDLRRPQSQEVDQRKANGRALSPDGLGRSPRIDPLLAKTLQDPEVSEPLPTLASLQERDEGDAEAASEHDEPAGSERNSMDASGASSEPLLSRRSSGVTESDASTFGLGNMMSLRSYKASSIQAKNTFLLTGKMLYFGCTRRNIVKGFIWSLAITSMHYLGILALQIPGGYVRLQPGFVVLSAAISWVVCLVGCILMTQMETHLSQQFLFSVVATTGVAAMHFTGMRATRFYSSQKSSNVRGYPPELAAAIAAIAIVTCLSANYLLAHSATIARNKLAEIVQTRKKLWAAIAQKENAEAAARARSEFIASASHEIRTPLHQLQGYSDLLARTHLTEEGRLLLYAIQHATRSLSLITSNVLDWSRLEKGEAACRPVAVDVRLVCESIVNLLPNRDDEVQAELMVVVAPTVPQSLFLDETYVHRILINLLSNALKFTTTGYILLLVEMQDGKVVATVQDTGTGIPDSFLPDLFEPFKQAQTRGAQRGTGLGLSIIKQLLQKMQGTIDVSSKHQQPDDDNGSTFAVRIPTQIAPSTQYMPNTPTLRESVAVFAPEGDRTAHGICLAWQKFDFEVVIAQSVADLPSNTKYIWVTVPFLKQNQDITKHLMSRSTTIVLVPYDSPDTLADVPALASTPHIITLQRPLIWHRIIQTIADASTDRTRMRDPIIDKSVRFDPDVRVMSSEPSDAAPSTTSNADATPATTTPTTSAPPPTKTHTILLVEDNKINQKLGTKMLRHLGYNVLTADDGQHAIDILLEHDSAIDAILMDQSMPRKDGLTATREIRAMEEDGTLSRRRPIIAVTAVVGPEAQSMCRDAGVDDFLAKPLGLVRLGTSLRGWLGGR